MPERTSGPSRLTSHDRSGGPLGADRARPDEYRGIALSQNGELRWRFPINAGRTRRQQDMSVLKCRGARAFTPVTFQFSCLATFWRYEWRDRRTLAFSSDRDRRIFNVCQKQSGWQQPQ